MRNFSYHLGQPRFIPDFAVWMDATEFETVGAILSCYNNDRIVGAMGITLVEDMSQPVFQKFLDIEPVFISPDKRGGRIFYSLMGIALHYANLCAVTRYTFLVMKNNYQALAICKKLRCESYHENRESFFVLGNTRHVPFGKGRNRILNSLSASWAEEKQYEKV